MHRYAPEVELQLVRTMQGFTTEVQVAATALTPSDTGIKFSSAAQGQEVAELRNAYISVMKLV